MTEQTTITLEELNKFCNLSALPSCLIKIDKDIQILCMNNNALDFFSLNNNPQFFSNLFSNDETYRPIKSACEIGSNFLKNMQISNENKWSNISISHTEINNEYFAIVHFIDITEHKKTVTEISTVAEEAEMMNEMKSDFLATMSHEIRTPMQSIYGFLELITEEKDLSENVASMVKIAKNAASDLLKILDDVLDLAKVNAGKMELDMFEVPVRTLAYGVLECMEVKLQGQDIKLIPEIDKEVPFVVVGDPARLRQVLLNLIGNSMKFTEKGLVTLHISKNTQHIFNDDGIALRFEIIDTGIGMPQEVADKLFQPFVQADSSTTRKFGGTGLGLSICNKLIELMGGKIGVDSIEGKGSTFWFEIPTKELSTDTQIELPDLDGLAVLSIEDHPAGAREIKSSLESMGAKVESCGTFKEGLELVLQRPFDVAIIDQGLPDGLGIDIARESVKARPFMGLIIYTVRDDIGLQHSAKSLGAAYLAKPASRLGLGEAVKAAARKKMPNLSHRPKRLLIAEDTASVRDVIQRQLEVLGVKADFVENGLEASKMLAKQEHGILFTDLHMPEMDGYELTKTIRDKEDEDKIDIVNRFPVIALTADVQLAQRQAYLSHGFDECLLKPITLGQLRQLLIRWGLLQEQNAMPENEPEKTPEKIKKHKSPPINKDDLIAQMGSFNAGTVEMLKMFIQMTEPHIEKITKAFEEQNVTALVEEGHSLKGSARSACCTNLGNIAHDIQEISEQGRLIPEELIKAMSAEFKNVQEYIDELGKEFE